MTSSCLIYLHALSPLHMGTGRGEGTIDLPHAREVHTRLPVAPGSGIKGVLRDEFAGMPAEQQLLFGGDFSDDDVGARQGALMFSDGALLCLPVRSLLGTFAWVTSPYLLRRYARDRAAVGLAGPALDGLLNLDTGAAAVAQGSVLTHHVGGATAGKAYLWDIDVDARQLDRVSKLAELISAACGPKGNDLLETDWRNDFVKRLVVVSDEVMIYFAEMALDVRARVRLEDDTKLVRKGHLWYEESLPSESILYAVVAADPPRGGASQPSLADKGALPASAQAAIDFFAKGHVHFEHVQMGGKATVGRGWVRTALERSPGRGGA